MIPDLAPTDSSPYMPLDCGPMRRRVLLIVNRDKPEALAAASEVRALIQEHAALLGEVGADEPRPGTGNATGTSLHSDLIPDLIPDLIVVLGGDGTLLHQAREHVGTGVPMLGVNLGKIGFMAEFDMATLRARAGELLTSATLPIRELGLLRVQILDENLAPRFDGRALNDAVITAGPPYRLITISLTIDGEQGPVMNGDGLVIATPTGSTAYNLSAGGPILEPGTDAMAVTPICAQSLSFRPIVVPGSTRVEARLLAVNSNGSGDGTTLVLDGQLYTPLAKGERVVITSLGQSVRFVRNTALGYWGRLMGKMNWAATPRSQRG